MCSTLFPTTGISEHDKALKSCVSMVWLIDSSASFEFLLSEKYTSSWVTMWPDFSGLVTFTCFYILIKQIKLLTEKWTSKASFFPWEATWKWKLSQFLIDSCHLVSQSNYLNNSDKDCDWLISAAIPVLKRPLKQNGA